MSLVSRILKGSALVSSGEATVQVCSLLRNVILARVLTKADFGVAALLGMIVSMMELGGRLSIEHLIIQSSRGSDPRFMAVAHAIQACLGVVSGLLILLLAGPLARWFGVSDAAWALRLMALLPFLKGISHLDLARMTRDLRFAPSVLTEIVPQVLITVAVWPLTWYWQSYAVLVGLLLAKQLAQTTASHVIAERPYRWEWSDEDARAIMQFGWPMVISSFLMFGIMQGDRFVVGLRYSIEELGVYAVAGTLALVPAATVLRVSGSVLLPVLGAVKEQPFQFRRRFEQASQLLSLFCGAYAIAMIVAGGALVRLIFGPKYDDAGALAAWLGLAQAIRLLRGTPTIAALAIGDSKNLMVSNIWRMSGLILAVPIALLGGSLAVIAACAALGELAALVASFRRFCSRQSLPAAPHFRPFLLAVGFILASGGLWVLGVPMLPPHIPLLSAGALVGSLLLAHTIVFEDARRWLRTLAVGDAGLVRRK